jgi:translation initiation factor IF-2
VKKRKEKALREREKEVEDKRKRNEKKTTAGSYKARAVVTGPVQVGKIDFNLLQVLLSEEKKEAVKALLF